MCCHTKPGESYGCETKPSHVFRSVDASIMDSYIPFIPTPPNEGPKTLFSAAIDCEMGYTSHGYEMIRLTVVDWMTGKTVLDKMVRPYGKIIDLNTRFSGISDIEEGHN